MAPESRITHPKFQYTPASKTDIRRTFLKHGWIGPEECRSRPSPAIERAAQSALYRQLAAGEITVESAEAAFGLRALFA